MKRILTLVLAFLFLLSPLAAFGSGAIVETAVEDEDSITRYTVFQSLDATVFDTIDIGELIGGQPGIYASFFFDIGMLAKNMNNISGEYSVDIHATIVIDWREAARLIAISVMGKDAGDLGLGGSAQIEGWNDDSNMCYTAEDGSVMEYYDEVQKLHPNWKSVIKNSQGQTVIPEKGSYLLFKEFKIDYKVQIIDTIFGSFEELTQSDIWLFVLIDPDPLEGAIDADPRPVKVYLTFPDLALRGPELWLEGKGTLVMNTILKEIEAKD